MMRRRSSYIHVQVDLDEVFGEIDDADLISELRRRKADSSEAADAFFAELKFAEADAEAAREAAQANRPQDLLVILRRALGLDSKPISAEAFAALPRDIHSRRPIVL